ncbi:MAG: hypothetical protein ACI4SD_00970 [Suilimivivens sp.]
MPQTEIEIHFEQMKGLSQALSQTAEGLRQTIDTMGMETLSGTKAAWISANADIFAGKEVRIFERITEISMNLSGLSEEVYEKAKQIYELEQRNALMAKARRYR